jgi:hypothetical protein
MSEDHEPLRLSLSVVPDWSHRWPAGICKECGTLFEGTDTQRWCSERCSKSAHGRANRHAQRTKRALEVQGKDRAESYETVGRLELLTAFRHSCGKCGEPLALPEVWVAHILGVEYGGQHTRANIAPVHKMCEQEWNAEQRLREPE